MKSFDKPLSPLKEAELLEKLKSGDLSARNTLVECNMRLVPHIAKKYNISGQDYDDIISVGAIGLIKAVNTFNAEKGNRLVTYACKCIENEILMFLRGEKKKSREISIYEPVGTDKEGNSINLLDILEADHNDILYNYEKNSKIKWLFENFNNILTPNEATIISRRYGLFGQPPSTQRELSELLGISRSYISRIEKRCLIKIKASYEKNF